MAPCCVMLNLALDNIGKDPPVPDVKISLILAFARFLPSTEDPAPTNTGESRVIVSSTPPTFITLALGVP